MATTNTARKYQSFNLGGLWVVMVRVGNGAWVAIGAPHVRKTTADAIAAMLANRYA